MSYVRKKDLDTYLDQEVCITLFDGSVLTGYLMKTGDELVRQNPNLYLPKNYYFLVETLGDNVSKGGLFRCSHIRKLERRR